MSDIGEVRITFLISSHPDDAGNVMMKITLFFRRKQMLKDDVFLSPKSWAYYEYFDVDIFLYSHKFAPVNLLQEMVDYDSDLINDSLCGFYPEASWEEYNF